MSTLWIPPRPSIITPAKWLAAFATAGKGVVTDSGKRGVGSNGKARAFDSSGECAECCGGGCVADTVDTCGNCDDITPLQFDVTFQNISACSACFTTGGLDTKITFLQNPNATFRLDHKNGSLSNTNCLWEFQTSTDYVRASLYFTGDGSCNGGGAADFEIDDQILIQLTRNASTWELIMTTGSGQLFCDTQTANTDGADQLCATVPSFTNDITTCGAATCPQVGGDFDQATGGTADVVCVEA